MKRKNNALLIGTTLFASLATIAGCSSSTVKTCSLVKELAPYDKLEVHASTIEGNEDDIEVTFNNTGDKYVPLEYYDSSCCYKSGVEINGTNFEDKCPFEHRYIAPNEKITVTAWSDGNGPEKTVGKINGNGYASTCYYTSEYTKMKFEDLKIKVISEEERREKKLFNRVFLCYKPSGHFVDGDNYNLLVNFNYNGLAYTVMSTDPEYEMNAFGLEKNVPYRINDNLANPGEQLGEFIFDESKLSINWVKCYTVWKNSKQANGCKDVFYQYKDKTKRFLTTFFTWFAVIGVLAAMVIFVMIRSKRKKY